MEIEKEITLSNIRAHFTRNFDTFSAMDPFLVVTIGTYSLRTQVLRKGGTEPSWKTNLTFPFTTQTSARFQAFDQDATENQPIGSCVLQLSSLKGASGVASVYLGQQYTGDVMFDITVKEFPERKLIVFRNIALQGIGKGLAKNKHPVKFVIRITGREKATQAETIGKSGVVWKEQITASYVFETVLEMFVVDKKTGDVIIEHNAHVTEFDENGHMAVHVHSRVLSFDYSSINRPLNQQRRTVNEFRQLNLNDLKLTLKNKCSPYVKIIIGLSNYRTQSTSLSNDQYIFPDKIKLQAESQDNRLIFLIYDKGLLKDTLVAVTQTFLSPQSTANLSLPLTTPTSLPFGTLSLNLSLLQTPNPSQLTISEIRSQFARDLEWIGKMDPYIKVTVGACEAITETIENGGTSVTFKRRIDMRFVGDQTDVGFICYDDDMVGKKQIGTGTMNANVHGEVFKEELVVVKDSKGRKVGVLGVKYKVQKSNGNSKEQMNPWKASAGNTGNITEKSESKLQQNDNQQNEQINQPKATKIPQPSACKQAQNIQSKQREPQKQMILLTKAESAQQNCNLDIKTSTNQNEQCEKQISLNQPSQQFQQNEQNTKDERQQQYQENFEQVDEQGDQSLKKLEVIDTASRKFIKNDADSEDQESPYSTKLIEVKDEPKIPSVQHPAQNSEITYEYSQDNEEGYQYDSEKNPQQDGVEQEYKEQFEQKTPAEIKSCSKTSEKQENVSKKANLGERQTKRTTKLVEKKSPQKDTTKLKAIKIKRSYNKKNQAVKSRLSLADHIEQHGNISLNQHKNMESVNILTKCKSQDLKPVGKGPKSLKPLQISNQHLQKFETHQNLDSDPCLPKITSEKVFMNQKVNSPENHIQSNKVLPVFRSRGVVGKSCQRPILNSKSPGLQRDHEHVEIVGLNFKDKGFGFGHGERKPYPNWMEKNMKQNPAPGAYNYEIKKFVKGPSFGLAHKYYEKVLVAKPDDRFHIRRRQMGNLGDLNR